MKVKRLVPVKELDDDDRGVARKYPITFVCPAYASDQSQESLALDVFHETVPISTLEHFEITVTDVTEERDPPPEAQEKFAAVSWQAGDVQSLFAVDEARAVEFLQNNARHIQDRLVELGWGVLETLGAIDGLPPTPPPDGE